MRSFHQTNNNFKCVCIECNYITNNIENLRKHDIRNHITSAFNKHHSPLIDVTEIICDNNIVVNNEIDIGHINNL